MNTLIGPFSQLVTMDQLPETGAIRDDAFQIIPDGGIVVTNGLITSIGPFDLLRSQTKTIVKVNGPAVALPGFIDCHTHLCFAGSRAADYALRLTGMSYQEIAKKGGGILNTVAKTRAATNEELIELTSKRIARQMQLGITTCEVKTGYGLTVDEELRLLRVIKAVAQLHPVTLIPTCLAAHTCPKEYSDRSQYLQELIKNLLPQIKENLLCDRIDIFVDPSAFTVEEARHYLTEAKKMGFVICLHADQFQSGGSLLAAELGAISADHLEQSQEEDFKRLSKAHVVAVALPGASLGLGVPQPRVRKMLDCDLAVAIASDWNPGTAPMGNLLISAALLGASEKLSMAETFAGITIRAARALGLKDRGSLTIGKQADLAVFPCSDYREILYHQGSMLPSHLFIRGYQWY